MNFANTTSCCTALLAYDARTIDGLTWTNKKQYYQGLIPKLKTLGNGSGGKDFAIFYYITTAKQTNLYSVLEKLGFTRSFLGQKATTDNRHQETGDLTMWCVEPRVFLQKIDDAIQECDDALCPKLPPEEITRREKFALIRKDHLREMFNATGNSCKSFTNMENEWFPFHHPLNRKTFLKRIEEATGGYNPMKDPFYIEHQNRMTWSQIYERAVRYREGKVA